MRGRSIRPQQLPLQSPQRAISPMIQMQPVQPQSGQTSEITNLKCSQVLMGLEIQRLNQVLIDMEKKKQIKMHQFQEQENILLLEIQQQREANTELQQKEKDMRDRLSIKLQQSNKQEKEVKDLQHLVRKLQSENELLDQKVSYLLNLNQYSQQQHQDIPRDTGHFLDDQEELLNLNQQISQLKTFLINGKQGSRVHIKYANLAEMHLELVQSHINAIKRLPDVRDVEIQQMQVYLTTLNKDLEALRRYETPVAVRRILNNQSPGMNRSLSPSMSSDEVFMKILGHIEHLQKDSQNIPTIIKQISLLNQLVRLKNEDLKLQGHKKTVVTHSPMKYSAGKQISPIRFSPIRVSPVRVSPTTYGVSAFSIPQRISIYPQRVLFESHPISTQHQRQERHSQPARQQTEGHQIEESQALDQHQGQEILLRQKSLHIQELQGQLKQLQNDLVFEHNRMAQLENEIQQKNDEISQLKRIIDQRIDDQAIKQEIDRLRQKLEISNQEKQSIETAYQQLKQLQKDTLQKMQEQSDSQQQIQQQEVEQEIIKRSASQYQKEISDLTRSLNVANAQVKKLSEMNEKNQQQINNLIIQLAQVQQDYPEIQVEVPHIEETDQRISKLQQELQEQQKTIDSLQKKNQELENMTEKNIVQELQEKLKEKERKELQILAQLKNLQDGQQPEGLNELQQKVEEINNLKMDYQNKMAIKDNELKELRDLVPKLENIIENFKKDLKDSQQQTKQQELQVTQAQQQVQLWKGNYDQLVEQQKEEDPHTLQSKLVEESAKVANLNSELQQAKHDNEIIQAKQSDENKGLQKQVDHWKQKYQEAMDQFTKQSSPTSVQNQLVQTTKQLHDAQEQVTQLEHQMEQIPKLEESVQTLKKDLKDSQQQTKQQELQVNQAQQQVQLWKENYDQLVQQQKEEDPHTLQSKLVEESAKVANLNSELQQAKHDNEIIQAKQSDENKGLQKQVDHWKQKYQEAMDQFTKQSSPTSVQNQLVQTTKQLHDAQEQVTQLEHQMEQIPKLEESVQTLKKDLKDSQQQTKQQELQVNQAQQQVQLWKGNYDQLVQQQKEEDPHTLQSKLVEESAKVANLNSELQQAKHDNEIIQAKQSDENKGLQKQVDHWKQKYQEAMDQFTKQSSPTSVQNQLVQTTKQLHDAQEQVTQLEHQMEQIPKLEESVQTLKKDLKDSQQQTKQQELQVNQAQQQVQLWKGNYDQLVEQQKEEDPHTLQSKLVEESAKVANLNSELQQAKHDNEIIQAKQSDENKGLQKQVDHWKQKYQEAMDQFTKQSSPTSVQNQLVQTTKQLHDSQEQVTQLEHQMEQIPKLEESVQTLKKDLKDSQQQTKQQELQVTQAQQQVQLWKGNYDQLVQQQKEEDPHTLQSKLVEESAKVANLNSELQQAKHDNENQQKQIENWKQKYQETMDQFTKQSSPTSVQNQLVQTTKLLHEAQDMIVQLEHKSEQVPQLIKQIQDLNNEVKQQKIQQLELQNLKGQLDKSEKDLIESQQQTSTTLSKLHQAQQELIQFQSQQQEGQQISTLPPIQFAQDAEKQLKINQLEQKVQTLNEQISLLQTQLKTNTEAFKEALGEKGGSEATTQIVENNRALLNDNTQIKNQLTEAQQQLIKSQNEITKLNRAILDIQKGTQIDMLQQELKGKEQEIQTLSTQIDHWKQKYQQTLDQFSQQSSPSGLQQQLLQATQNIHQLEEQIQIQSIELQQIAKLKSQIAQLEQMVSHGNQEVEFWKKKYNELSELHTKSQDPNEFQSMVAEILKLKQIIQELQSNEERLKIEFQQQLSKETQEITNKLEDARRVLKLQESQINLLNQENSMLKNSIQQFQRQKEEILLQKSQLSQQEFWKQKYAELLEQVKPEQATEIIKEQEQQSAEQIKKLIEQSEEIQTDDQELALLQQQIQELQNNNSQLRQSITQNNVDKLSLQNQMKEVQNELNQALTKLIQFQESSGPQQERQMKFEKDPELLATISKLEQQNQTLSQHLNDVEEQRKKDQERFSNIIGKGANEQQIVSLLEENQNLQANARSLTQKLEQEQHEAISLQNQIMNLNKKILELSDQSKLQQLQDEINELKTEQLKTQQQVDHWKNKYQEVLEQFSKEASPKSLQNQLATSVKRTHELEEEVKIKQIQIQTELPQLQAKILELQEALQQSKKEGILWNEKYDDLVKRKESIQTAQEQSQELEKAKQETGFWKDKYTQLVQLQSEEASPQSINAEIINKNTAITELIAKNNQLELQVNELQKKLQPLQQQVQQPQKEESLLEEIANLTNQIKQQQESFTQTTQILNQQLENYQSTVSNQNKQIAELKNKLIEMQAEKQGASEFWKQKYAELLEQVKPEQASEIIKEQEQQSAEQIKKIIEQSEEIQTDDQELALLQQQIQELQNNNSQLRQSITQNNVDKLSLQNQMKEVQNELNQALTKLIQFQESSGPQQERQMKFEKDPELLATISKLEQQNQTLSQHLNEVEEQRKKDQERFSNIIGKGANEQQIVSLLEENQNLQANARSLTQKLEQEQHEAISLQNQIMNLNKKILELSDQSKLQQLQDEINELKTEQLKTQQQVDHWKNKYQEVLEQFSKEASPKSLQNQLATSVKRTHELEEEVKIKQIQIQTELPQLQAKILELQEALQQSKKEGILWNEKYDDLVKRKESIQTAQEQSQELEKAKQETGFWKDKYTQLVQLQSEEASPQSINAEIINKNTAITELIAKNNQLELQVNELQKKLQPLQQQVQQPQKEESLLEEIANLTNQIKQQQESFTQTTQILNQQLENYQSTVSNQNKQIAELKNKLIEMQAEKQGASEFWKQKYAELLEQVKPEQATEIIKEQEQQSAEQIKKIIEQSEEIQTDDQELALLQQQIQELQNNNSQLRQSITQNNVDKLSLQNQMKEVQNELNQALTKLIQFQESSGPQQERQMKFEKDPELLATISKLEQQNQTLSQHVNEVEEQRKKDQERFSNIVGKGANEQQIVSLLEENQNLQANARSLTQKLEQEQHEAISLQNQIMNLNKKILELSDQSKLQQLQDEINELKTEQLKTQQQVDHWKNKYQEVLEQFSKEASPKSLQNQLATSVKRTHELEEEVKIKQIQIQTELPQLQAKILELQEALQQSKKEGILWNEKYDDLVKRKESIQTAQEQSQELEKAKQETGFWKDKYTQLVQLQSEEASPQSINAEIINKNTAITELIAKNNQLELQVNELQKKLQPLQQQVQQPQKEESLLEEIANLTNQIKQQQESFTQTTQILNQQLENYQSTVSNQNKQIAELKNKLIEMQAEKQGASEFWKQKYAELLEQVKPEQATEIIKEQEQQSAEQIKKIIEQSEEIQTDDQELALLQQQIQELQNNNSQLRQSITQNNVDKLSLQNQMKEVQNELNQALTKLIQFQESSGPQQERQMKFEKDPELLATISKLEQQNQTLSQHLNEVEEQRKKDQERFSNIIGKGANEQQIVSLLEENQNLQANARSLTQKLEQEQHEAISLQNQIMNLNKKILELSDQSKLQQLQDEINELKTEQLKTQQQVDHWKNKYQEVLEQFSKEASPKSLQNQLATSVKRTHELEEEVKIKQIQIQTELPQLQAKILELQEALQQSKKEGILWNEKYDDLVKRKESIQTAQEQSQELEKAKQETGFWKDKYTQLVQLQSEEASPQSINAEIINKNNAITELIAKNNQLELQVNELQKKLQPLQQQIQQPQTEQSLIQDITNLRQQIEIQSTQINTLTQVTQTNQKQIDYLTTENTTLKNDSQYIRGNFWKQKYNDLLIQNDPNTAKEKFLQAQQEQIIEQTGDQYEELKKQNVQLEENNKGLQKQVDHWKQKYQEAMDQFTKQSSPTSVQNQLVQTTKQLHDSQEQVTQLEHQMEQIPRLEESVQTLKKDLKDSQQQTKQQELQVNQAQQQVQLWKGNYDQLVEQQKEEDPHTLQSKLVEESAKVANLNSELQQAKHDNEIIQAKQSDDNKGLQKQVDHWKQKYQEAMDQFTKQSSPTSVQNQLVQTTKQLHDAQEQVTQLEHQMEQIPKLEESVQTLKKDLKDSQQQTKQQELQVNQAQQQVQLWKGNYDQLVEQQKEEDPHTLQSKLVEESAKVANLNSELQQAKHDNEIIQAKQSDDNKGLQKQVDHWKQKYQEAMDQFTKQSSPTSVQNQLVQTTKQLHDAQEQVTQLEHQMEQIPKLEESVQTLKKDLKDSQQQTKQQELQVTQAQQQVQLWKGNYDQLVQQQKEEDPHTLQSKLVEESAKVANLNSELQQAKHDNEIIQAKQSDENKGLQKQVDHWKQKYSEAMDQFTKQSSPTSVQNQLVQTTKQLHDAQEQVTQLEHQMEQIPKLEESVQTLKKDLKDSQQQTKQQELQVTQAQQQVQLWKGNYDQLVQQQKEEDPHTLQSKLVEESAKVANLNSELQQAKHDNEIIQAKQSDENKGLQKQVDHWKQKYSEAMDQFTKQSSPTSVQNQLVQTTKQLHDAQEQVTQLEHQMEQIPKLEESVQTLKKDLKDSQQQTKQQELQVTQAQQQVQLWKGNYDQLVQQQKEEDPHTLQSKLVEESAKVANLNSELQQAKHDNEIIQAKQSDENKGLQKQVDHWKQKYQEAMDQFTKQSSPTSVQNQLVQTTKQLHDAQEQVTQLEHQMEQIPKLEESLQTLKKDLKDSQQQTKQQELQVTQAQQQVQLWKGNYDQLVQQQKEEDPHTLQSKLVEESAKVANLNSELQQAKHDNEIIQAKQSDENKGLQKQVDHWKQKYQEAMDQFTKQSSPTSVQNQLVQTTKQLHDAQEQVTQLEHQMEQIPKLEESVQTLKKDLKDSQQQTKQQELQVTQAQQQVQLWKGNYDQLVQQQKEEDPHTLQSKLAEESAKVANLNSELQQAKHDNENQQKQIENWKQKYQETMDQFTKQSSPTSVQNQLVQTTKQLHEAQDMIVQLEHKSEQVPQLIKQIQDLNNEVKQQKIQQLELQNLKGQLDKSENDLIESQQQTSTTLSKLHQAQQELIQLQSQQQEGQQISTLPPIQFAQDAEKQLKINQLEQKVQTLNEQISLLQTQLKTNAEAFKEALGEKGGSEATTQIVENNRTLLNDNTQIKNQLTEAQQQLIKSQNEITKLNRAILDIQKGTQADMLQQELKGKEQEIQTLSTQIDHWKQKYQQTLDQFSQQSSPSGLQQQLLQATQTIHQLEEQIQIQSIELQQIAKLKSQIAQLEQMVSHGNQEVEFWKKKYESVISERQKSQTEGSGDLSEQINKLIQQRLQADDQINRLTKQNEDLQKLIKKELDKDEMANKLADQQKEINKLHQQISIEQGRSSSTQPGDINLQNLIEVTRKNNELEKDIQAKQVIIKELKENLQKTQEELNEIKNQDERIKSEFWRNKYEEVIKAQVVGQSDENNRLKQEKLELQKEITELQQKLIQIQESQIVQPGSRRESETNILSNYKKLESENENLKKQVDDLAKLNENIINQMKQALSGGVNEQKLSQLLENNQNLEKKNNDLVDQQIENQKRIKDLQSQISVLNSRIIDLEDPSVAEQTQIRVSDMEKQLELIGQQVAFWKDKHQQVLDEYSKQLSPTNVQQKMITQAQRVSELEETLSIFQKQYDQEKQGNEQIIQQLQMQIKYLNDELAKANKKLYEQRESTLEQDSQNKLIQFWRSKYEEALMKYETNTQVVRQSIQLSELQAQQIGDPQVFQVQNQLDKLRNENQQLINDITFYKDKITAMEQISKNITQEDGSQTQQDTIIAQQQMIGKLEQKLKLAQEESTYWNQKYKDLAQINIEKEMGGQPSSDYQQSASYWRQKYDEAQRQHEQEKLILQQQLEEKEEQLEQHMQSFQSILKDELKEELTRLKQKEEQDRQEYEQGIQQQILQQQRDMDNSRIQKLQQEHEKEKEQLIKEFLARIDQLIQSNVQKYPEGENWKELILKYEKQRQNELYELRQQLEILQRSYITSQDVEFFAERRAYENKINELKSRIIQDDPQDLYDTIEYQRNQILDLSDQVHYLQNERTQLEMHVISLNQQLDGLKENLSRFQQQSDQRRRVRAEVIEAIEEMKKDRERDRDSYRSPYRQTRYSHKSSWERERQPRDYLRQSNQQQYSSPIQMMQQQQSNVENKEIVNKLQELDEVKHKYQTALNNILRLEAQVIDKLQQDDVLIE